MEEQENSRGSSSASKQESATDQQTSNGRGLDLGPIAMSFGSSAEDTRGKSTKAASDKVVNAFQWQGKVLWFSRTLGLSDLLHDITGEQLQGEASISGLQSIHSMKTEEWQQQYEADGYVDLWVEEEFNSGSRLVVSFNPIIAATGMLCLWLFSYT